MPVTSFDRSSLLTWPGNCSSAFISALWSVNWGGISKETWPGTHETRLQILLDRHILLLEISWGMDIAADTTDLKPQHHCSFKLKLDTLFPLSNLRQWGNQEKKESVKSFSNKWCQSSFPFRDTVCECENPSRWSSYLVWWITIYKIYTLSGFIIINSKR